MKKITTGTIVTLLGVIMISTANASLEEYSSNQEENTKLETQENCKDISSLKERFKCYKEKAEIKAKDLKEKAEKQIREKNKCGEEEETKECLSRVSKKKYEKAKEKTQKMREKAEKKYSEIKEKSREKIMEAKMNRISEKGVKTNISDKMKTRLDNKIDRFLNRISKLNTDKQIEVLEKIKDRIENIKEKKISKITNEDKKKTYIGIFDYFNQRITDRLEKLEINTEADNEIDNLLEDLN